MDDLISREAALDMLDHERKVLIEQGRLGAEHIVVHHARRMIEDLPAVEAVPVVRCKDCKYAQRDVMFNDIWCDGIIRLPDWFCAEGKRRDGDT